MFGLYAFLLIFQGNVLSALAELSYTVCGAWEPKLDVISVGYTKGFNFNYGNGQCLAWYI
jgi:hypothetical protein